MRAARTQRGGKRQHRRRSPRPVDAHVGSRVRQRRTLLGMNLGELSAALGLSFQQVQKYERGGNRISASRLYDLGRILNVPITYFFDAYPGDSGAEGATLFGADVMNKRETLTLVRAYYGITEPKVRRRLLDLIRSVSNKT